MEPPERPLKVAVVGPSASGKSTLVAALRARGIHTRHVAQEHSYVPDMWRRISRPDVLIYLDVSYEESRRRRPGDWGAERIETERARLAHARQHADLVVLTDGLAPEDVLVRVLEFLEAAGE